MTKPIVLITGAAGFIGRHIARHFAAAGWSVHGAGNGLFADAGQWGVDCWHPGEVDAGLLQTCTREARVLIHCAGGASVGRSVQQPGQDLSRTVQSTSDVLEFIRISSPGTRLVYPSSAAVYGQVERLPILETDAVRPMSPYGLHKSMAEALCQLYTQHYGLQCTVLRLFSIYGRALRKQLLWDACEKLSRGDGRFFGTGAEVRDWLHVDDLVRLVYRVATAEGSVPPVVNAASGQGVAVRDILGRLQHCLGLEEVPLAFTAQAKTGDPQAMVADISVAQDLGWSPAIDWRDGIRDYADWYRQ